MLDEFENLPAIPGGVQMPAPEVEVVANAEVAPVGESPDEAARRLADEKFAVEAKVRLADFMDRLGMEQEPLIPEKKKRKKIEGPGGSRGG